ncbi:MAG: SUMF1/EgtB/PvdO family nonheme iron enzyme, partial [Planctomycetota bacterium]
LIEGDEPELAGAAFRNSSVSVPAVRPKRRRPASRARIADDRQGAGPRRSERRKRDSTRERRRGAGREVRGKPSGWSALPAGAKIGIPVAVLLAVAGLALFLLGGEEHEDKRPPDRARKRTGPRGGQEATRGAGTRPPKSKPTAPPKTLAFDLGGGVTVETIYIKPGVFAMGGDKSQQPGWQGVEKPKHEVAITRGFYIGRYEITRGQFAAFVKATKYRTEAERAGKSPGLEPDGSWSNVAGVSWRNPLAFSQTDDHPVIYVSWNDVKAFCEWLADRARLTVRLPTEGEWEYACRAGTTSTWSFGDDERGLGEHAWYKKNSAMRTHPVGGKKPNPWGLYDVHGNVWEWVADRYDASYFAKSPREDPTGPPAGRERVLRGSSWGHGGFFGRAAIRCRRSPSYRRTDMGFRIAVSLSPEEVVASTRLQERPPKKTDRPDAARPARIPPDAVPFGGHRYKLYAGRMIWPEAKLFCERLGGHLVTITSKEENAFVVGMARAGKDHCWIGLTDEAKERKWQWVTGEAVTFYAWAKGEPNSSGGNEDWCSLVPHAGFGWNDDFIDRPCNVICEWEPGAARPPAAASPAGAKTYRPPDEWPGTEVGATDSNPFVLAGKPLWRLDQVWPDERLGLENYRPMPWDGKAWRPKEHTFTGHPCATAKGGKIQMVAKTWWPGQPGNKLCALVFIAPADGLYRAAGTVSADVWYNSKLGGVGMAFVAISRDTRLAVPVGSVALGHKTPVAIGGPEIALKQGQELAFVAHFQK